MATTNPINNESNQSLEMFSLIWLDSNPKENRNTEQKLRSIINQLKKFHDINKCEDFIEKTSAKDRLIVIVSGRLGKEIVPKIHSIRQVISIYIYCMDKKGNEQWSSTYSKVKAVVTNLDELISAINDDHRIENKIEEPLAINIFSIDGKSTSELNGKFVFSQVLIDCLLRLKSFDEDRNELIQLLKQEYQTNQHELDHINDFEIDYTSKKALEWYSKECFFYKTLNSILRTENIHLIFLYRSFIFDIQQQLHYYQSNKVLKVYRGQIISKNELENLKKLINQFISINSFFSTTELYSKAISFFKHSKSNENTEKILFQIKADPNVVKNKPFANISRFSVYPHEEEVLFMIGSIFRIQNISFDTKNQFWIIEMILSSDDENDLKQVLTHMKQQTGNGDTDLRILGEFLSEMGKFDLAEKYFHRLLRQLSSNDSIIGDLYENLAKVASRSGDFDKSMQWHKKSIEFKQKNSITTLVPSKDKQVIHHQLTWKQHAITIAGGNEQGEELNQLAQPCGIYLDHEQQSIYIAERLNHRIVKWKFGQNNGQVIAGGNGRGNRIDQLNEPTDVILDRKNKSLIISDQGNRRVVRWSLKHPQDRQIIISDIDCRGLAMNDNGDLFVSDYMKHEVKIWRKGELEGRIVAGGNGKGDQLNQFNTPTFIFVDRRNTIYVSDKYNHRVMKWVKGSKEGIVVAGGQGQGNDCNQLNSPRGVNVNDVGDVYVADWRNHRIVCWPSGSKEGRLVVGGNGIGQGSNQFNHLMGLAFDHKNNLYVVDEYNHRIQRFDADKR